MRGDFSAQIRIRNDIFNLKNTCWHCFRCITFCCQQLWIDQVSNYTNKLIAYVGGTQLLPSCTITFFYVFILFENIMQKCSLYSNWNSPVACLTTFSNARGCRAASGVNCVVHIISTRRGPWVIHILYNIMLREKVISKKSLKVLLH